MDKIRGPPGGRREQETEDEDVIIAKKISTLDQQVKALQGQLYEITKDSNSAKKLLTDYVAEQRERMGGMEKALEAALAKLAETRGVREEAHCPNCDALNTLPANFCDRCGSQLL